MCKKPCRECPFNRKNVLGNGSEALGESPPEVYVGQIEGPFWLPCHMDKRYKGKQTDPNNNLQCAGAAIYRANIEVDHKMPRPLLRLEKDTELVFADHQEFLMHYLGITREQANSWLDVNDPMDLMMDEMRKTEARRLSMVV